MAAAGGREKASGRFAIVINGEVLSVPAVRKDGARISVELTIVPLVVVEASEIDHGVNEFAAVFEDGGAEVSQPEQFGDVWSARGLGSRLRRP